MNYLDIVLCADCEVLRGTSVSFDINKTSVGWILLDYRMIELKIGPSYLNHVSHEIYCRRYVAGYRWIYINNDTF
jgi:hypothetical protein